MERITTLLADDHEMILSGFKGVLAPNQISIAATTTDPDQVLPLYEQHRPDVAVLDVRFCGREAGLSIATELLQKYSGAKIVFYSQFDQMEYIKAAYQLGAKAFVTKAQPVAILIDAIRHAHENKVFVPPLVGEILLKSVMEGKKPESPASILNERELHVFRLMASGKTTKYIAAEMNLSLKTISTASQAVKDKLGIHRPAEMAHLAIRYGLITPIDQGTSE